MAGSLYDRVGGRDWFFSLVGRFYAAVAVDPVLRPMYPEDDLDGATQRLALFLIQYWGGPDDYEKSRGHPRLRRRHAEFLIGDLQRQVWYGHMAAAVQAGGLGREDEAEMLAYFSMAADSLVNHG